MGLSLEEAEQIGVGHLHPDRIGSAPKPAGRVTKNAKGQNKTEANLDRWLDDQKRWGRIWHYEFEAVKIRLADRRWYTPDFAVWLPNAQFCFVEVKGGFVREDGMIKLQVAAEHSRWPFYLAWYESRKWTVSELPSRSTPFGCLEFFNGL